MTSPKPVRGKPAPTAVQTVRDQVYKVSVKPDWTEAERLRDFVGAWMFALKRDATLRDAVIMVTAELLENAMRHGKSTQSRIDYEIGIIAGKAIIRVANEVERAAYERLADRVRWIASVPAPGTAFTRQIENISQGAAEGLGLTRAAYEGGCDLTCKMLPDGRAEVVAVFRES